MADEDPSGGGTGETGTPPPPSTTFTQEDMTRVAAREKDQGKRQGQREVLETLGFASVDEAKGFAQMLRDAEQAQMSEAQKAQAAADKAKQEAEAEKAEAKRDRYEAKVERELIKAGISPETVAKVSKLVESDVDSSAEDIATAVADLRESMPQLFTPSEPGSQSGTPKPTPSDPGKAPGTKSSPDPSARASERLKQRHGGKLKSNSN